MKQIDIDLGWEINKHLTNLGIETPGLENTGKSNPRDCAEDIKLIQSSTADIMSKALHLNMNDDSLCETPMRVAKMYVNELFYGLDYQKFPKCTVVENKMQYDEIVLEKNIKLHSMCEHHLLPIIGVAAVAYIPSKKVLGLSKLNRIVDFFASRPQIQERLAEQIYQTLVYITGTDDVAVILDGEHFCVKMRGVEDACSSTVTSKMGGRFRTDASARMELLTLLKG